MANKKYRKYYLSSGIIIVVLIVVIVCWPCFCCWFNEPTTVMLVRHAEKVIEPSNTDPGLTPAGEARAAELVHVVGSAGISAIFVSNTTRARRTAQDLAADLGLMPIELPANAVEELVEQILSQYGGETVFVVGHSNTLPDIIEALGGYAISDIDEQIYDNLFVVSTAPCWCDSTKVVNLKYGEPTPGF